MLLLTRHRGSVTVKIQLGNLSHWGESRSANQGGNVKRSDRHIVLAIAATLGAALLTSPPATATDSSESTASESSGYEIRKKLRASKSNGCMSASMVTIKVDSKEGEYSLGSDGGLKEGRGAVEYSGCTYNKSTSEGSKKQAVPMQASLGSNYFSPNRAFYFTEDRNSRFWAQQSYDGGLTTAYRWAPSDSVKSIAYGPALKAYAFKTPDNCSYNKAGEDKNYIFHWSCSGQSTSKMYNMWGQWEFRAAGPGWSGYATIVWDFEYGITYV